jgi:hypothetical protein
MPLLPQHIPSLVNKCPVVTGSLTIVRLPLSFGVVLILVDPVSLSLCGQYEAAKSMRPLTCIHKVYRDPPGFICKD